MQTNLIFSSKISPRPHEEDPNNLNIKLTKATTLFQNKVFGQLKHYVIELKDMLSKFLEISDAIGILLSLNLDSAKSFNIIISLLPTLKYHNSQTQRLWKLLVYYEKMELYQMLLKHFVSKLGFISEVNGQNLVNLLS